MNFGAHICVADRIGYAGDAAHVGLGSALPDLAAIGRFRLRRISNLEGIDAGVTLHYRTDEAFHSHSLFSGWQKTTANALASSPLSRGAIRAVAHVGPELLIDGVLLRDTTNRQAITDAIGIIPSVLDVLEPMVNPPDTERWSSHLEDVSGWPVPGTMGDPVLVAQRMHRILQRRPRLAFDDTAIPAVAEALEHVAASITENAEALTSELASTLSQ